MKQANKIIFGLVVTVTLLMPFAQATAQEQGSEESIQEYAVDITMSKDSSIAVKEKIAYDFGAAERHGILRDIPYQYKARGGTFKLRLSDVTITDDAGTAYAFTRSASAGEINLKIGDPDKTITGLHIYNISYTVKRAINYFEDHDELYWNAIGTGWPVAIQKSSVTVHTPSTTTNAQCYIGASGSTETLCTITDNKVDTVSFKYARPLAVGEGFTVAVGVPAGTIAKPTAAQKYADIARDNGILALPLFVLGIMFFVWRIYGKDARGKGTVVSQYDPPKSLSPLYMGALVDGKVDNKDISAEIIFLAEQGHMTIERTETTKLLWFKGNDYTFTKLDKPTDALLPQSKAVFAALFATGGTVKLSEFKKEIGFGKALMDIRGKVFSELTKLGYYRANPRTIQTAVMIIGIVLGGTGAAMFGSVLGTLGIIAAITSGLIITVFGYFMPARTQKGSEVREYILGLKKYMGVAEQDRLEFHNAPNKDPKRFEMLLPFAMALGVERLWANQFKGLYDQKPLWYNDVTNTGFNAAYLSSSMNDFSGSVQAAAASATSSASGGGSGFSGGGSGGGGGGGGGGSW